MVVNYPIIDADGHVMETDAELREFLEGRYRTIEALKDASTKSKNSKLEIRNNFKIQKRERFSTNPVRISSLGFMRFSLFRISIFEFRIFFAPSGATSVVVILNIKS